MTVLHLNQSDLQGGAALAGNRLHLALGAEGIDSRMLVGARKGGDAKVGTSPRPTFPERALFAVTSRLLPSYDCVTWGRHLVDHPWFQEADVVHLHNIHTGMYLSYLTIPALAKRKPLVITLHDMWHFTGHCSYSYECPRWQHGCGRCPHLDTYPAIKWDSSALEWRWKRNVHAGLSAQVIAPAHWLAEQARMSLLSRHDIQVIPYTLDLTIFQPLPLQAARVTLGWPQSKSVILAAAADLREKRKGFAELLGIIRGLPASMRERIAFATLGDADHLDDLGCEIIQLGYVTSDETKALIYSASDCLAFPSLSDNLPLVVMEALSCGLPVIAFSVGGVPDMVKHGENGYLSDAPDPDAFRSNLMGFLEAKESQAGLRAAARKTAEKMFSAKEIVRQHEEVYEKASAAAA